MLRCRIDTRHEARSASGVECFRQRADRSLRRAAVGKLAVTDLVVARPPNWQVNWLDERGYLAFGSAGFDRSASTKAMKSTEMAPATPRSRRPSLSN